MQQAAKKKIKIVSNAGGLNPKSMAAEIEKILNELSIDLKVAYIDGDDLIPRIPELKNGEEFQILKKISHLKNLDVSL